MNDIMIGLAGLAVLGIGAQWLAWRLGLPSILLLLLFGFAAGPATGLLNPDRLFGDLLFPIVSVSVAVILFEGGLDLRLADLRAIGGVVRNLLTVGSLATWVLASGGGLFLLGFDLSLAILLGAILVVTGPTVMIPMLRHVRPRGQVGTIAKWEGIMNDPVGAVLAVLVFEAILASGLREATSLALFGLLKTVLVGVALGALSAGLLVVMLRRYWIPDALQNPVTLSLVVGVFTLSNQVQHESGLLTVTLMGIFLANQKSVAVRHIVEFKENLRVLLISTLFILLAARLQVGDLRHLETGSFLFLGWLILAVRPAAVLLSTIGSELSWRERVFLMWMAPRGIVAAAVTAVFALDLEGAGYAHAHALVPLMFLIIVGTVGIYGLTAVPVARWLRLAQKKPQGTLIVGAHRLGRAIGRALQEVGFQVLLVDTNWRNISAARMKGLDTYYGSILSEYALEEIEMDGIGRLLALTSNDEANSLATLHCAEIFGRAEVYQLAPESVEERAQDLFSPQHLRGRFLFGADVTFGFLEKFLTAGAQIKGIRLTERFGYDELLQGYRTVVPLFFVTAERELEVVAAAGDFAATAGQMLICLVDSQIGLAEDGEDAIGAEPIRQDSGAGGVSS